MLYVLLIAALFAADYFSKVWVLQVVQPVGSIDLIPNILSFTFHINYGAAFGTMQQQRWILIAATSLVIIVFSYAALSKRITGRLMLTAVSFIIAGGFGNLFDRIFRGGGVVDFIYFEPINFPIFNVADCCVTIGCCLLLLQVLVLEPRREKLAKQNKPAGEE